MFKLKTKVSFTGFEVEIDFEGSFRNFKRVMKYCERLYNKLGLQQMPQHSIDDIEPTPPEEKRERFNNHTEFA